MRWVGHIARMIEMKNACRILIFIPVDINIEVSLIKSLCVVNWIHLIKSTDKWFVLMDMTMTAGFYKWRGIS